MDKEIIVLQLQYFQAVRYSVYERTRVQRLRTYERTQMVCLVGKESLSTKTLFNLVLPYLTVIAEDHF